MGPRRRRRRGGGARLGEYQWRECFGVATSSVVGGIEIGATEIEKNDFTIELLSRFRKLCLGAFYAFAAGEDNRFIVGFLILNYRTY